MDGWMVKADHMEPDNSHHFHPPLKKWSLDYKWAAMQWPTPFISGLQRADECRVWRLKQGLQFFCFADAISCGFSTTLWTCAVPTQSHFFALGPLPNDLIVYIHCISTASLHHPMFFCCFCFNAIQFGLLSSNCPHWLVITLGGL